MWLAAEKGKLGGVGKRGEMRMVRTKGVENRTVWVGASVVGCK